MQGYIHAQQVYLQQHSVTSESLFGDFDPSLMATVTDGESFSATLPSAFTHISAGVAETADNGNGVTVLRISELDKLQPFIKVSAVPENVMPALAIFIAQFLFAQHCSLQCLVMRLTWDAALADCDVTFNQCVIF